MPSHFTYSAPVPTHLAKPRLRRREASEYLMQVHGIGLTTNTLAKLAVIGGGPSFQKCGRWPLYPTVELDRFAAERIGPLQGSTSQAA